MAMGPVQILVIGYGQDAQFTGAALDELRRLIDHDVVRLVDLLFVHKNDDGSIEKIELTDTDELAKAGRRRRRADRLRRGRRGGRRGRRRGRRGRGRRRGLRLRRGAGLVYRRRHPEGMSAGIAVLEHRWAIPLRDAIAGSGGVALADEWLHPQDLIALGIAAAQ